MEDERANSAGRRRRQTSSGWNWPCRASHEGIWDWRIGQREIYYSRRILEFLECGDSRAPNLFIPPHDSIHPDEHHAFTGALAQALEDGGPETLAVDARVRTGGDAWRWLRIRGTVVRDRAGRRYRIAGSMIDISRRQASRGPGGGGAFPAAAVDRPHPGAGLFQGSRLALHHGQPAHGRVDRASTKASSIIGKHDRDFFDEDHWQPAAADERRIIESGEPITGQLEHETWHEGKETWVVTSKFPWRDRKGRIKGTFGVSSDVTSLVTAQREATDLADPAPGEKRSLRGGGASRPGNPAGAHRQRVSHDRERPQPAALQLALHSHLRPGRRFLRGRSRSRTTSVGVLICDVMGHGVRAALIVAMLRGLLEKQRAQAADPGAFLSGLNEGLASILERAGSHHVRHRILWPDRSAGGDPELCLRRSPGPDHRWLRRHPPDRRRALGERSRARSHPRRGLSVDRSSRSPEIRRIVLFTDGVLEAENHEGEPFFETRLMEIIGRESDSQHSTGLLDRHHLRRAGVLAGPAFRRRRLPAGHRSGNEGRGNQGSGFITRLRVSPSANFVRSRPTGLDLRGPTSPPCRPRRE